MVLSNTVILKIELPPWTSMISDNQWRAIGEYMDETSRNLRTITMVVVVTFIANLSAAIWFYSLFY